MACIAGIAGTHKGYPYTLDDRCVSALFIVVALLYSSIEIAYHVVLLYAKQQC